MGVTLVPNGFSPGQIAVCYLEYFLNCFNFPNLSWSMRVFYVADSEVV